MVQRYYKDIKELILDEFDEYLYAGYSPLGATVAILKDYNNYFEYDSREYYKYIKSLYLINCTRDNLEWYKEYRPGFLEERVIPQLMDTIRFEPLKGEMKKLIHFVNTYLFIEIDDINQKINPKSIMELIELNRHRLDSSFNNEQSILEKVENPKHQNSIKINELELEQALKTKQKIERNYKEAKPSRRLVDFLSLPASFILKFIEQVLEYTKKKL
ncbi:hypothetical protein CN978_25065 [Priestia megaterium]|uniref:hypothetical protein n=1 Tax=Priestia megaterium TaxID=1404 RepID=UPI000BFE1129|nr:hypothetical protein [Priestia megaterium]PGN62204.1 hypothetical protein CN978_25065 [Priestia megaterium]